MAKLIALTLLGIFVTLFIAWHIRRNRTQSKRLERIEVAAEEKECKIKQMFEKSAENCKDKISEENLNALKENEELDNEEVRNFQACIYKDTGFLKDAKFDVNKIKEKIDEIVEEKDKAEVIKTLFENCAKDAEGESDVEVASKFTKCMLKTKKDFEAQKE